MWSCGFLSLHCEHVRLSEGEGSGEACTGFRDGDGKTARMSGMKYPSCVSRRGVECTMAFLNISCPHSLPYCLVVA